MMKLSFKSDLPMFANSAGSALSLSLYFKLSSSLRLNRPMHRQQLNMNASS